MSLTYKEAYKHEAWGTPTVGVKILVSLPCELDDDAKSVISKADDMIFKALDKCYALQNTEGIEYGKEAKRNMLTLFDEPIFVEEIPNEYSSYDYHCPWFMVTTKIGHIKIGWRKRVIDIDWSKTIVKKLANVIFPNEEVTMGEYWIHAWGYDKAKQYLTKLFEAANESS